MKQQLAVAVALVIAFSCQYVKAERNTSIKGGSAQVTNATQLAAHSLEVAQAKKPTQDAVKAKPATQDAVHSVEAKNVTQDVVHSSEVHPLQIADAVVHAVELAEHGSGRLLASLRAATQSAPQSSNPKETVRAEEMMDKIVTLMRTLRPLAGRLRTEARSEIEQLKADAARQQSLSELAESRLVTMKRDEDHLQNLFQDEMQKGHRCFEQLTESQRLLNAKMNETDKVLHLRKELEKARAAERKATQAAEDQRARMEVELADSRIESQRVHEQLKAMHEQNLLLSRQNSRLLEAGRGWAARVAEADDELRHFNVTRRAYEVKLAELSDKLGELEEQHEDQVDESKQLESANEILKKDNKAGQNAVTTLKKELDAASEDKVHLLDSVRSLIHQNDELKSQPPRQQLTPVAAHAKDVTKVQTPVPDKSQAAPGDAAAADWREFDEIAWMGRTAKIDNYLSGLSDEEKLAQELQEQKRRLNMKAHRHPKKPSPITNYLGAEFHPTPAESQALHLPPVQAANAGNANGGAVAESKHAPDAIPVTGAQPTAKTDTNTNFERKVPIIPALRDPRPRHRAADSHQAKKISPQIGATGAVLRGSRRVPKWAEAMKNQSQALEDDAFQDLTEAAKLLASVS
mmetsp:Transcript_119044/g.237360  ORF Transcript_119044/g.237360 Transcript_119044/m.237360 type:complete len:633 (+) Transcript_119044:85-1983(+)